MAAKKRAKKPRSRKAAPKQGPRTQRQRLVAHFREQERQSEQDAVDLLQNAITGIRRHEGRDQVVANIADAMLSLGDARAYGCAASDVQEGEGT